MPGGKASLPSHYDAEHHPLTPSVQRLTNIKKSLLRRIPPLDAIFSSSRRISSTSQPTPWSILSSAPAFPSGDTVRFVLLCCLWYASSALSSNTGKSIMNQFRYPVTLTFVQFGFVAGYCLLFMSPLINFSRLKRPSKAILHSTFPMGCFQVGGHIFSSMAISRIPVSTVHTIKALSPLFTVAAYALFFGVSYSPRTYLSLLPLTLGVMLACSFDMSASNAFGLLMAFGSAIIFVTQNIFFKKIMPSNSSGTHGTSHKLDKLNLLFYSSGMAFLLMVPIWVYTDLPLLFPSSHSHAHPVPGTYIGHPPHGPPSPHGYSTAVNFFLNGSVHFLQNVLAFVLLARTSPVTYSIASLIKRVAVICIAVVWFAQTVHPIQAFGICLTFAGLWFYHGAKGDVDRGEKKVRRVEEARDGMLPINRSQIEDPVQEKVDVVEVSSSGTNSLTYSQTHPSHPNLHIQISSPPPMPVNPANLPSVIPIKAEAAVVSPVDSYPSPPPSIDSPTDEEPSANPWKHRRGTITNHGVGIEPLRAGIAVAS
ncbi:triose-phosphate transporter family-domain-containing protein [Abortiporus biennis]|nr:triose-phosphate transporter family-domain-containing protein [Abortiporus biennis]